MKQRKQNQPTDTQEAQTPWNKGKSPGQKAPFDREDVKIIKRFLEKEGNTRDLALFSVAIDTMLRAVDLLALKVEDVTDNARNVLEEFTVQQKKTGDGNIVTLGAASREALTQWIRESGKLSYDYLFTGRNHTEKPITGRRYRNIVKGWAKLARLDEKQFSSHSLRRTKAAAVFRATNNVEVVRELLGHSSVSSTSAYLNIGKKKALEIARKIEF